MADFVDMILYLQSIGLADVLLPFFLVFTVSYAVLGKTTILGFGDNAKRFNILVSLVLAFSVVIPHVIGAYPPGSDVVVLINSVLPQIALVIIAIIMLLLMIGAFGGSWQIAETGAGSLVVLFSIGIVVYIFGRAAGWFHRSYRLGFLDNPQTQAMIVTLLVFGIIVWLITKEDKPSGGDDDSKKARKSLDDWVKFQELTDGGKGGK